MIAEAMYDVFRPRGCSRRMALRESRRRSRTVDALDESQQSQAMLGWSLWVIAGATRCERPRTLPLWKASRRLGKALPLRMPQNGGARYFKSASRYRFQLTA